MEHKQILIKGIGFFGLLAIVFITLKLCDVIDWSWWLVLLPLYGPPVFTILMIVLFVLTMKVMDWNDKRKWKKGGLR